MTVSRSTLVGDCTITWCDSVNVDTIHHHNRMGVEDNSSSTSPMAAVYPNPFTENATLHIENMVGKVTVNIFDISGRLADSKINLKNGDFELSKKDIGLGFYLYSVSDESGDIVKGKFIIQ